jgi:hypothetical protein
MAAGPEAMVIEIGDDEEHPKSSGASPFSAVSQGKVLTRGDPVLTGAVDVRHVGAQTEEGMDHIRLARLVHHIATSTAAIQRELGLLPVQAPVTPLPGTGAAPATPPGAIQQLAAATAAGVPPPPLPETCPIWFSPTSDGASLSEPAWHNFSVTHEDDAYVMVDCQTIVDALHTGLPDWASSEVVFKVVSSLRFGRPQAAGPMCHSWVPIRTVGKMVRAILGLNAASAKLPAAELIRLVLLTELTEGGETLRPLEL